MTEGQEKNTALVAAYYCNPEESLTVLKFPKTLEAAFPKQLPPPSGVAFLLEDDSRHEGPDI